MKKVLIVDDSRIIISLLKSELENYENIEPYFAYTYQEAKTLIDTHKGNFHAAVLDYNLTDAKQGEIIALVNAHNIPIIVLTSSESSSIKEFIKKHNVAELILKDGQPSIKYTIKSIDRILKNYDTTVLIVDDSRLYRQKILKILKQLHLNTLEASNGDEALEIVLSNKKISVVLTDYEMPQLDGLELTYALREKFQKDQLAIIAMSSDDNDEVTSNFLKYGANDFIHKPFTYNEVTTRVNANLEILEMFQKIKDMANKDFLTGAYNRRFFFEVGEKIYKKSLRKKANLAVAMLDIDHFKKVNDTYGHDVGDIAIKEVKKILSKNLRSSDLMARFGGEEFCVLLEDISFEDLPKLFEKIRQNFENNVIKIDDLKVSYTVSIGIYYGLADSLEEMIRLSDEALFEAKENGRNKVVIKQ